MNEYLVLAALLIVQNAAFTWVSRARNSSSITYHAFASVCSNLIFILNQGIIINKFTEVAKYSAEYWLLVLVYTVFTVVGSIAAHKVLMTYVEKGLRKVGA